MDVLRVKGSGLRAVAFAAKWHEGQFRKYTPTEPYFYHVVRVASLLASTVYHADPVVRDAAIFHDLLEDTDCPREEIEKRFGADVLALVDMLTEPPKGNGMNRKLRKELYARQLGASSPKAKTIKACDIYDNISGLVTCLKLGVIEGIPSKLPYFKMYVSEKFRELEEIHTGCDLMAFKRAALAVSEFEEFIKVSETALAKEEADRVVG